MSEVDPEADSEERITALVEAAFQALPDCAIGVLISRPPQRPLAILRSPLGVTADFQHDRLFPEFPFERAFPFGSEDGAVLRLATSTLDQLQDPAMEAFMRHLTAALRGSLRHGRSREAFREQIIQSDKLASLGQIAAGVIHELNNPLTSILAYTDYLHRKGVRTGLDAADLERLSRIHEAATRIQRFSRDLTTYARPSLERPIPLAIHDVIDRALLFCEHVLEQSGVVVLKRFGEIPLVLGVHEQLTQVFVNLFTNAAQALRSRGSTLEISTRLAESGEFVVIEVSDDGSGVEADHLPHIFDPFFTTRTDGTGTGLGLSIVRNIIHAHGGHVRASAQTPHGMSFALELPAVLEVTR
ncbi:sensor histidine kinase [Chondromyces crocatus]|nr:ATP-binding protein [Chondromyces crocatus]